MASPSQSSATDLTHCWCPELSPLTQYSWRLRDQYVQRPVVSVRCSSSSFIQPSISTSPVSYCCAIAATSPLGSRLSRAEMAGSRPPSVMDSLFPDPDARVAAPTARRASRLPSAGELLTARTSRSVCTAGTDRPGRAHALRGLDDR